jgi:SAM-dependent methyltransferase/uncharacterized Rossmann fold enzyme
VDVIQILHQNDGAEMPLIVPVIVVPNTGPEVLDAHVARNASLPLPWFMASEPHDRAAIICGGGPSLQESYAAIRAIDGDVFGLNGAAQWLLAQGIACDQIMIDAQEITARLVEPMAGKHYLASNVHPTTLDRAPRPVLFHMNFDGIEDLLPLERVEEGGYTLIGGGVSVGITAMVLAYAMGYRTMHFFGYDSSNRGEATHAYPQAHNAAIPNCTVEWAGRTFHASMPMKLQAEAFFRFAEQLKDEGCELHVHGDGLLPAMWHNPPRTEREKYQLLWAFGAYRHVAPGEAAVDAFLHIARPSGRVLDFGCGTGRAALALADAGLDMTLIDFTDNCRDREALKLPFIQWDLTKPLPARGDYGFCTDVMEHIPPGDVAKVLANIMASGRRVWFQIATRPDQFGATIGETLHLTVQPHAWWKERLESFGRVEFEQEGDGQSTFYVIGE